jgi:hypothetical protein
LINNRQNGRRRGRGGPQVRNGSGNGPERGNRIDNRARGNAAQLHEKYRNLARDAQTQGDRVMTEYYLQFADHYFRVLSEGRARFEEQNPNQSQARRPLSQNDDFDEGYEGEAGDENGDLDMNPRREAGYDDGEQPPRGQNGGDNYRDNHARDNQGRDNQPREGQPPRDNQQQGREYRGDGQRGSRDNQYGRNDGRNGQNNAQQNHGQQARDNRPPAGERDEQRPSREAHQVPREAYQPRDAAPADPASPPPAVEAAQVRPRRGRPPRRIEAEDGSVAQIEVDRLPPAFAPVEANDAPPAPRGRRKSVEAVPEGEVRAVEGEAVEPAPRRRRLRREPSDDSNVAA